MLPAGGADVRDEFTDPGRHRSSPQGQFCPTCGRHEPDPWARFCGACGGTIDVPSESGQIRGGAPETVQVPAAPVAPGRYDLPPSPHVAQAPQYPAAYAPANAYQAASAPPMVYRIPSVGIGGSARMGAAVVAAFSLVPCLLTAFAGAWLVHEARKMFDSWQSATVRVPAFVTSVDLTMNFIDLLRLRPIYDILIAWDDRLWMTFAVIWLIPWVALIVAGALFAIVMAVIYNIVGRMGGGLRVTVTPDQATSQAWAAPMSPPAHAPWPPDGRR